MFADKTREQCYKKLSIINEFFVTRQVFVHDKLFQPSLMFVSKAGTSKAGTYPNGTSKVGSWTHPQTLD